MRIEYTCADGSRTLALWPSMALMHWLGRSYPTPPIKDTKPFGVYVTRSPVPIDDDPLLLTLVFAEIERRWNKTPPGEAVPLDPTKKRGGRKYQARCLEILRWLHAEGDITKLTVSRGS
jgi:hypothetical protein